MEANSNIKNVYTKAKELFKQTKQTKQDLSITNESLKINDKLLKAFPNPVQEFLDYASPLTDGPDEFMISPFLAICGALIGRKRYVMLGSTKLFPTIWTVLFAGSSQFRKSTALRIAKDPFGHLIDRWKIDHEKELKAWVNTKKECAKEDEEFNLPKPILKTLYCPDGFSDLTFWEALRDQGSLVSSASEFTALWQEITHPRNNLSELSLSLFDAEDHIQRSTKSGGNIILENPVWCIIGATTVENFQKTLTANERGSGLLQRILPVYVGKRTKPFQAPTELPKPDKTLLEKLFKTIEPLSELNVREVRLTKESDSSFTEWSHNLNDRSQKLSEHTPDIGQYISRLNIYGLKFALIFQQLDDPKSDINESNTKAAIILCEWFLNHIVYMLNQNYIFSKFYRHRLKIREILKKQSNGSIARTNLMNLSHLDKADLDRALDREIEAGIIEEKEIGTPGRTRHVYYLTKSPA